MNIGPRLRRARIRRKLSQEQLAQMTGLSKGFISQVERDMTAASVASLVKLCEAVQITVGSLFQPSQTMLITAEDAPQINFGGVGLTETIMTPRDSSDVQLIWSDIAPGGGSGPELYSLDAKAEVAYVIEGSVVVTIEEEAYALRAGDALTFSPRQDHSFHNPSSQDRAVVLWALAPSPW